jgi:MoaA/NifB/PqqE/SkfB family radical SAM enzyme
LKAIGLSIDGMRELHDRDRVDGSWHHAFEAIRSARELGMTVGVNTQIGPETAQDLSALADVLVEAGVKRWWFSTHRGDGQRRRQRPSPVAAV